MKIVSHHDGETLAKEAARLLEESIHAHSGDGVLVLLSGGSALSVIEYLSPDIFTNGCTVSVVDERYTEEKDHVNFYNASVRLHEKSITVSNAIDTSCIAGESFDEYVKRINAAHREWRQAHPNARIVGLFGIGEDGHTAGIFPATVNEFKQYESMDAFVPVPYGNMHAPYCHRITASLPFIRSISEAVVYVVGDNKRNAVNNFLSDEGHVSSTPARILREIPQVTLCTSVNTLMI